MEKIGTFKINTSYNVTQLGIIAGGILIDGKLAIGASMLIEINEEKVNVKIIGISRGNPNSDGDISYGVRLSFENENFKKFLEQNTLQEQVVDIES